LAFLTENLCQPSGLVVRSRESGRLTPAPATLPGPISKAIRGNRVAVFACASIGDIERAILSSRAFQ